MNRFVAPGAVLVLALAGPALAPSHSELPEDPAGARYLPPLTRAYAVPVGVNETWIVTGLTAASGGWRARHAGRDVELSAPFAREAPRARLLLLGTDGLGRDLLARLLLGARHSVAVACACVVLTLLVGVSVGASAGLAHRLDAVFMRSTDLLLAIPRLLVYLLCACLFGPSTLLVVLIVGLTAWPGLARLVRASTRAIGRSDALLAARAAGCTPLRLVALHVLPAVAPVVAVTAALRFADAILLEAALSFLGIGSPPPAISLGGIIASGRDMLADAWWISAWPGLTIVVLVLCVRSLATRLTRVGASNAVA